MKDVSWPSIAIATPTFNQLQFLPACMASVLDQGYANLQYAVMDAGSTDGSVDIIKSSADRLHYWRSRPDNGPYAAIAEGFANTDAEILGWINSDDILLPWALKMVGGIFRDCPQVEWLTTEVTFEIRADGLPFSTRQIPGFNKDGFRHRENLIAPASPWGVSFIQQESTFWRRSLWDKSGARFDSSIKLAGDFELWDRFFDHARLYSIDIPLGAFRFHSAAQRSIATRAQYVAECEKVLSRRPDTAPHVEAFMARRAKMIGLNIRELDKLRKPIYIVRRQADTGRYIAGELNFEKDAIIP
jgi:glycosyltransferase involved in cell wall biosynthesis